MATLAHGFEPALVAAHLGRPAPFITRATDYLFAEDSPEIEAAIAVVVAGTPVPQPVPASVPAHHMRRALAAMGLLATVQAYIDALPESDDMRIDWEYAPTIRRDAVGIEAARVALGLTEAQVDALFVAAGQVVT